VALPSRYREKGRLGPGQMIAVDLETHEVLKNWEIKQRIAQSSQPYGEWLAQHHELKREKVASPQTDRQALLRHQIAFGYNTEDVENSADGKRGQGGDFAMGDDIPSGAIISAPLAV